MKDKRIIQRNLPLDQKYTLIEVFYRSGEDKIQCDNCGMIISNVAHIKGNTNNKNYHIGLDCLDTILENNSLLNDDDYLRYQYSDKPAIAKAKALRSKILKGKKNDPTYEAELYVSKDNDCFGFSYSTEDKFNIDKNWRNRLGFDFTFNVKYIDLTLEYIKGLYKTENDVPCT